MRKIRRLSGYSIDVYAVKAICSAYFGVGYFYLVAAALGQYSAHFRAVFNKHLIVTRICKDSSFYGSIVYGDFLIIPTVYIYIKSNRSLILNGYVVFSLKRSAAVSFSKFIACYSAHASVVSVDHHFVVSGT